MTTTIELVVPTRRPRRSAPVPSQRVAARVDAVQAPRRGERHGGDAMLRPLIGLGIVASIVCVLDATQALGQMAAAVQQWLDAVVRAAWLGSF